MPQSMDLNRLTHDADDLIRKVVSRYNQLYIPAGNISQLELDLMLDDLRKLYDTFKNIGHINLTLQNTLNKPEVKVSPLVSEDSQHVLSSAQAFSEKQVISPEPAPTPYQPQPDHEVIAEAVPETKSETEFTSEPEFKSEPEAEVVSPVETIELTTEPETETEPASEIQALAVPEIPENTPSIDDIAENSNPATAESAPAMLADKYNTVNKSLSETMASTQAQSVMGSRLQFQPISDLITGIGLNDKFSFISDLFGNSAAHYDEAITRINKAVNIDEANWILQKYHTASWDQKQETLARMKDFVKRRFI